VEAVSKGVAIKIGPNDTDVQTVFLNRGISFSPKEHPWAHEKRALRRTPRVSGFQSSWDVFLARVSGSGGKAKGDDKPDAKIWVEISLGGCSKVHFADASGEYCSITPKSVDLQEGKWSGFIELKALKGVKEDVRRCFFVEARRDAPEGACVGGFGVVNVFPVRMPVILVDARNWLSDPNLHAGQSTENLRAGFQDELNSLYGNYAFCFDVISSSMTSMQVRDVVRSTPVVLGRPWAEFESAFNAAVNGVNVVQDGSGISYLDATQSENLESFARVVRDSALADDKVQSELVRLGHDLARLGHGEGGWVAVVFVVGALASEDTAASAGMDAYGGSFEHGGKKYKEIGGRKLPSLGGGHKKGFVLLGERTGGTPSHILKSIVHEIGHFLGFEDVDDGENVMHYTLQEDGRGVGMLSSKPILKFEELRLKFATGTERQWSHLAWFSFDYKK
jgi:hypothetical protein